MRRKLRDHNIEDVRFVGTEPYMTRRGEVVALHVYELPCVLCGDGLVTFKTTAGGNPLRASKRCFDCRRKRRRRVQVRAARQRAIVAPDAPAAAGVDRGAVLDTLAGAWEAGTPLSIKHNAKRYAVPVLMHLFGLARDETLAMLADLEASGAIVHEALAERGERSRVRGYRVVGGSSVFD